jgi:L-asparaginase
MKNHILIVNTGGTFNKFYDPVSGTLIVDQGSRALEKIASKWLTSFEIINIIGKDSLDMTSQDRLELLATLSQTETEKIIVVHGTDTMHISAQYLADADLEKEVVLTGAMVPFSIDPIEAAANLASAYGFLQASKEKGIYIAMNGIVSLHTDIIKEKDIGRFVRQ